MWKDGANESVCVCASVWKREKEMRRMNRSNKGDARIVNDNNNRIASEFGTMKGDNSIDGILLLLKFMNSSNTNLHISLDILTVCWVCLCSILFILLIRNFFSGTLSTATKRIKTKQLQYKTKTKRKEKAKRSPIIFFFSLSCMCVCVVCLQMKLFGSTSRSCWNKRVAFILFYFIVHIIISFIRCTWMCECVSDC